MPITFPRADRAALAAFDPATKVCSMNCGPHLDDLRSPEERRFLCEDCTTVQPTPPMATLAEIEIIEGYARGLEQDSHLQAILKVVCATARRAVKELT